MRDAFVRRAKRDRQPVVHRSLLPQGGVRFRRHRRVLNAEAQVLPAARCGLVAASSLLFAVGAYLGAARFIAAENREHLDGVNETVLRRIEAAIESASCDSLRRYGTKRSGSRRENRRDAG